MDKPNQLAAGAVRVAPVTSATVGASSAKTTTSATFIQIELPRVGRNEANGMLPAWLALVGVIVTLIGKWIADIFQRRYELRRQLYLDLVDAVLTTNSSIGKLCDPSIALAATSERFQSSGPAIAKVEVTAPEELSQALAHFKDSSGAAYMRLMAMRVEVERLKAAMTEADIGITQYEAERRVFLEEQRRMIIEGIDDPARKARIKEHYDIFSGELKALREIKGNSAAAMQIRVNEMAEVATEELKVLAGLMPPVLEQVRKGLGYWRFDLGGFKKRTDKTFEMVDAAIKGVQDSVNKLKPGDDKKN